MSSKQSLSKPSKSRNGCHRCKTKHIKCDETKPRCQICIVQGAECPGYAKQLRWSNKHEVYADRPKKRAKTGPETTGASYQHDRNGTSPSKSPPDLASSNGPVQSTRLPASAEAAEVSWSMTEPYGFEDLGHSFMVPDLISPSWSDVQVGNAFLAGDFWGDHSADSAIDLSSILSPVQTDNSKREIGKRKAIVPADANASSSSAGLLQTFYRMAVPGKVPGFSDQDLVSYYFDHVCAIFACFDSKLNPLRTWVMDQFGNDKTTSLTIQAMAGSHLANFYPHMAAMGIAKRSQAWKSLQHDLPSLKAGKTTADSVLLNLLLLGLSCSWNNSSGLGLQYLCIARSLVQIKLQKECGPNDEFILDALIYWEMLASFVDPVPMLPFSGIKSPELHIPPKPSPRTPHSWTGLASESIYVLAEVGRVLRRRDKKGLITKIDDEWTSILENALYAIEVPQPDDVVDYSDPKTSKADLIAMAEAYRHIALLEIYRSNPKLLLSRVRDGTILEDLNHLPLSENGAYQDELDSMLARIAVHVIDTIKGVHISSGACKLLPLIVVVAGSQLKMPDNEPSGTEIHDAVLEARYVVEQRLTVMSRRYPQRPMSAMLDIVKEVWQRVDPREGESYRADTNAHWLDIMHEKSWQVIMG
ncbi:Beauvericin cluster-specific repressor BEA4 [Pseudocercospora fuligena]|uniref:Beauvericin cluster-specific repressor BEA4 n=1 Tax=Pseudocercospora fuligena TaxID=685502 RepID=A0A8H6VCC6_9PEZI|nr:Beauvericin cluster-specific repressor BEA4 [Pseudocercospora fuligena]